MARRGLVSKGMGGPQGGGGSALMPKGEKPKGPQLMPVSEVARLLRVEQGQVDSWISKGQMRGNSSGIRPYDFKKFQLDFAEEIKRAQKESLQQKNQSTKSDRKPKKGFFSRFTSIFGGGKEDDDGAGKKLAQENRKLKDELKKLKKKQKPDGDGGADRELEEKLRYLEKQVSESRALEAEVARLRRQVKDQPDSQEGSAAASQEVMQELEQTRQQLAQAQEMASTAAEARRLLAQTQAERDQLQSAFYQLQTQVANESNSSDDSDEVQRLRASIEEREQALAQMQRRAQDMLLENERLRQEAEEAKQSLSTAAESQAPIAEAKSDPLVDDLLALQRANLERFKKLRALYLESKIEKKPDVAPDQTEVYLALEQKYKTLLAQQSTENPAHQELMEQLSQSRVSITRLKEENTRLRSKLTSAEEQESERIKELENQLEVARPQSTDRKFVEKELDSLRKGLDAKETQLQKLATKLSDNEKRLSKAMQESARLTELLIERENRLRELSNEFEQEYREKIGNLDRQVSGLQWKLSLREERIAVLESELLRKNE